MLISKMYEHTINHPFSTFCVAFTTFLTGGQFQILYLGIDSELIKWSLSIIVQICDNNRIFCYRPSLVACSGNYNWWAVQYGRFFTARRYARCGIYRRRVSVRLFVCVSVTFRYCIKTAKRRITQIMPHDRVFK